MKDLVIYGAGGLGKEMIGLIQARNAEENCWNIIGFLDDDSTKKECFGYKVLGDGSYLENHYDVAVVVAVGNPTVKQRIIEKLPENIHYPTLIHPSAVLLSPKSIALAKGCVITAGCVLTCDIVLDDFVLLNLNTTVGHDVRLAAYSSLMCGVNVAGFVTINKGVFVGSGANILNGINIGIGAKVGAGAVVTKNVPDDTTAVGVPAKIL